MRGLTEQERGEHATDRADAHALIRSLTLAAKSVTDRAACAALFAIINRMDRRVNLLVKEVGFPTSPKGEGDATS